MSNSKCNKCGLVNPAADLACRRCGGLLGRPVRKSLIESKTTYPRYLFLLPFLLLALGLGYWSSKIKQSAINAMNVDKPEWHESTMDGKVGPQGAPVETKPRNPFDDPNVKKANEEVRKQIEAYTESIQHPRGFSKPNRGTQAKP